MMDGDEEIVVYPTLKPRFGGEEQLFEMKIHTNIKHLDLCIRNAFGLPAASCYSLQKPTEFNGKQLFVNISLQSAEEAISRLLDTQRDTFISFEEDQSASPSQAVESTFNYLQAPQQQLQSLKGKAGYS